MEAQANKSTKRFLEFCAHKCARFALQEGRQIEVRVNLGMPILLVGSVGESAFVAVPSVFPVLYHMCGSYCRLRKFR